MKNVFIAFLIFLGASLLIYFLAPGWILQSKLGLELMSGGFNREMIVKDGQTFHYYDNHRPDKPVLLMLHGFADRKESWLPFVNRFSRDYRIILPDAMGHGANGPGARGSYDMGSQADYFHDLVATLDLHSFHLIGISMGGGIAGKYAGKYPEDLRSLTFISSAGLQDCERPSRMDELMDGYTTLEEKINHFPLLPETYSRAEARLFKEYIFHKNIFAPNRLFKEYMTQAIEHRDFYIDVLDDFVDIRTGRFIDPLDDELKDVKCPVLVIWGNQDPLLDVSCAAKLSSFLPEPPELVLIDKCGHATIVEQPKETFIAMRDFLKKVVR